MIRSLSHTIENDELTMPRKTIASPPSLAVAAVVPLLLRITTSAPARPITMPTIFIGVNRSIRKNTEITSTRIGPSVAMIEASIGLVCWMPTIRNSFFATPISTAAPMNFTMSPLRCTRSTGTKKNDSRARIAAILTARVASA